jgi:hypothetical protein
MNNNTLIIELIDPVDTSLRDDYRKSDTSTFIEDDLIVNEYTFTDKDGKQSSNYHKSYGYLRTPELAGIIKAFLLSSDGCSF